jgi:DNA-binding response OmpR family regulator
MRILLVEDEADLASLIRGGLSEEGHAVDLAVSGEEAFDWVRVASYDAIVLDVMLPGIGGLDVCRTLRRRRVQAPILLLTARDGIDDRVRGLDAGADDYLVKPFAFAELFARLRALSRRPTAALDPVLQVGDVRLDPGTHQVSRGGREISLSPKEFRLLEHLLRHPTRVLTRTMIAEHIWDYDFPNVTNVIDVHIGSLRRKLNDPYPGRLIQTVRGVGYRIAPDA